MSVEASHELRAAMVDEYDTWLKLRAHLPGCDPDAVDVCGLTSEELALVETHLAARARRRRLLEPVVPLQG